MSDWQGYNSAPSSIELYYFYWKAIGSSKLQLKLNAIAMFFVSDPYSLFWALNQYYFMFIEVFIVYQPSWNPCLDICSKMLIREGGIHLENQESRHWTTCQMHGTPHRGKTSWNLLHKKFWNRRRSRNEHWALKLNEYGVYSDGWAALDN